MAHPSAIALLDPRTGLFGRLAGTCSGDAVYP
jgi:hypothetical protein